MKAVLFLCFFLLPVLASSQEFEDHNAYCPAVPYYDYALCAKGMKDSSGTVVLEPRYSEITALPGELFLVCENEKYGVLSCDFEIVIPLIYKKLVWSPKYECNGLCSEFYYWFFETDEGTGVMNASLEVIFPPVYETIGRVALEPQVKRINYHNFGRRVTAETAPFFQLTLNGKSSISNEFGKEIVPDHFTEIQCFGGNYPTTPTPKLPSGIFFLAKNDSTQTIISENGEAVFTAPIEQALYVITLDSSTIIQITDQNQVSQFICLESGVSTSKKVSITYEDDYFLYRDFEDQSFEVYGRNLRLLHTGKKWAWRGELLTVKDERYLKLTTGDKRITLFKRNGDVLFQTEDMVITTESDTDGCIWRIPQHPDKKEDTLRVYFPNGKLKREYVIKGIAPNHFFENGRRSNRDEKLDELLFIQKGSKWGAFDRNGDLKIPFNYDHAGIPYWPTTYSSHSTLDKAVIGYYMTKSGKMGSVDRSGSKLYACKYDTLFSQEIDIIHHARFNANSWPEFFIFDNRSFCPFAIKKGSLVTLVNGKEQLCDSTFLTFENPLLLFGNALVNEQGKVIREIKKGTIHKTKGFFFNIQGDVAHVIMTSGKPGLTVENFKSAQVDGDYLKIKLKNETMGVLSLDGSRWLYAPKYYDITFTNFTPHHAWVKEDTLNTWMQNSTKRLENYDGRWMLVDTAYAQLFDFPFKFPVNIIHSPRAIFESDNQIGMIDSSLNLVFPPDFQYIHELRYSDYSILYKDSLWWLGHSSGAISEHPFNSISYQEVNKSIAVFSFSDRDTLIGFIRFDNGLKWLVPFTEMHELINKRSLRTLLRTEANPGSFSLGLNHPVDSLDRWRVQNNALIVNYTLQSQCHFQKMPASGLSFFPDFEYNDPYNGLIGQQFFEDINTWKSTFHIDHKFESPGEYRDYQNMNNYPKGMMPKFYNEEILSVAIYPFCFSFDRIETINNYLYLDSIQKIELSDLLIQNEETSAFLREIVVLKFTENQTGEEVCPDLDKAEALMWSRFNFSTGGIQFSDLDLFLSYTELEPYLTPLGKRLNPWYTKNYDDEDEFD